MREHHNLRSDRLRLAAPMLSPPVSHVRGRNRRHHGWLKAAEWTRSKRLLPQCRHIPGQSCRIGYCNDRLKKFDAARIQQRDHLFLDGGANIFRRQIARDPGHFQLIQRRRYILHAELNGALGPGGERPGA